MKKVMLCALLVLLVCILAIPASAAEHDAHCLCGGSCVELESHSCKNVTWKPLPAGTTDFSKLEAGNYYLTSDVTVKSAGKITKDLTICLNGHNITTTTSRCFGNTVEATLTITDCSYANGTWGGTITGGNSIYGGIIYTHYSSVLNIYGGNFTGNGAYNRMAGLINIAQDGKDEAAKADSAYASTFNFYNGNIYGGKSYRGGNVFGMHKSVINMYGGSIHDGQVTYGEYDSTVQPGIGGNVYIDSNATFNMYGGKIYGGIANQGEKTVDYAGSGGNIGLTGTFNMYDGEIYDGYAAHNPTTNSGITDWEVATPGRGGNILCQNANSRLNIYGGKIWGGVANGIGGGNILVDKGTLTMSGGMIWGGIANADGDAAKTAHLLNAYEVCGGSVRIQNGKMTMTGGSIGIDDQGNPAGGTTKPSGSEVGNVYFFGTSCTAVLSGGTIAYGNSWLNEKGELTYGLSAKGGNIGGNGAITVTGDMIIRDGYTVNMGGNWTIFNNSNCVLSGGTISGGKAPKGGNISIGGSNTTQQLLQISGGLVIGGEALSGNGGNILIDHSAKGIKVTGGAIKDGFAKTSGGNIYSKGIVQYTSGTITGGNNGSVMVMEGGTYVAHYNTFDEAAAAIKDNQYIRLSGNIDGVTISKTLWVDLAGNDLTNVKITGKLYCIDTATDDYTGEHAGTLTVSSGKPEMVIKTTEALAGNIKRYLPVNDNGIYSFHRFYMAITKASMRPSEVGVGYKAQFVGSEYAEQYLSTSTAFGYTMWLEGGQKVMRGMPASKFGGNQEVTLRIKNFLSTSKSAAENSKRADTPVYASCYVRLADGTMIETTPVCYTFHDMLEAADDHFTSYSDAQKKALQTITDKFSESMITYNIENFHHTDGSKWTKLTQDSFIALIKKNTNIPSGSYVLTEDIDLGTRSFKIAQGRTINICLNGYTLTTAVRMMNTEGTLNICDCHNPDKEGTMRSTYAINETNGDTKEFTSIIYCYASSVTNLYGGNLVAANQLNMAAAVAVSHDKTSEPDRPVGVFNMYGGSISAAGATADGGTVSLFNGGIFNLYDGTVYGTTARYGGAFSVGTKCQLNIYGGTITGGTATGGRGGNIYSNSGLVNFHAGTITGGTSTMGRGGNIYSGGADAVLNISGGTISGGTATGDDTCGYGGNIYHGGTLNISGGTITDGTAGGGRGGNIFSTSATLNISGGTITKGTAPKVYDENGSAVYRTGVGSGVLAIETIVNVSGETIIDGNNNGNLYLYGFEAHLDAEKLTGKAKIGLCGDIYGKISDYTSNADYIYGDLAGSFIQTVNGRLLIAEKQYANASYSENLTTFSVGYDSTSIKPKESGLVMSSWGNPNGRKTNGSVGYEPFVSTVAITDKENNTILMITIDLQNTPDAYYQYIFKHISRATGVPEDHIYMSATHTHNCPSINTNTPGNSRYSYWFTERVIQSAINALEDRSPATMKTGSFDTDGLNYSRHYYYYKDNNTANGKTYFGDQFGQTPQNGEKIYRVRQGDETMHMIEFTRSSSNKKPVLVVNWRAHPHRSGGMQSYSTDADVIGATRTYVQNNTNYLFAYFQGAAGNMNTGSRISGETYKSGKIKEYGDELGRQIIANGLPKLKTAATGLIQTKQINYAAPVDHSGDSMIEQAKALQKYYQENPDEMDTLAEQLAVAAQYGFTSVFHATRLIAKYNLPETKNLELNIFSIGNSVAFYTAPAELWDSFSVEMESKSPFKTTFCIGYSNGSVAYIPYKLDYEYSYEDVYCYFKWSDITIQMMDYYTQYLNLFYKNA